MQKLTGGSASAAKTEWISVSRAMQLLERSRTQISHYIESGLLRERRIGARGWHTVPSEDVQKILESREAANECID
jgi:hypothetical protein